MPPIFLYTSIMLHRGAFLGRVMIAPAFRLGSTQSMTDADADLIESVQAAVVKFYSDGCPPCAEYKPIFNDVADRASRDIMMAEVDIDNSPGLASKYDIKATPTTVFLATGTELNRVEGKMTPDGLEAMIQSAFGTSPTSLAQTATTTKEQEAAQRVAPSGPKLVRTDQQAPVRSQLTPAGYAPAAPASSSGPSKAMLIVGGISILGIVTGALLIAKA
jgi:thioredoxin 1